MTTYRKCQDCGGPLSDYRRCRCLACYRASRVKQRKPGEPLLSTKERADNGCLLTFENEAGARLTFHQAGAPSKGIKLACACALSMDPSYRLLSYSTPDTILGDLDGARADIVGAYGYNQRRQLPEAQALGHAGLAHLLHPSLRR